MKKNGFTLLILLLTGLFSLFFFILSFYSANEKSLTTDEVAHIPAGFMIWKTGDFRINPEHPPLVKLWAALPLLPFSFLVPVDDADWVAGDEWHFGGYFLFSYNDANAIAMLSRFTIIILGVHLGWMVYIWGRKLFCADQNSIAPLAGLLGAVLFFTEPNLIAHSALVTYDCALAWIAFMAGYYYWVMNTEGIRWRTLALFCILMGVAPLIKVVGFFLWFLIFFHAFLAALVSRRRWIFHPGWGKKIFYDSRGRKIGAVVLSIIFSGVVFYFCVWAIYGFRYQISPGMENPPGPQCEKYLNFAPLSSPAVKGFMMFLKRHRLLPQGYLAVLGHALLEKGRFAVLLGETKIVGGFYTYFLFTTLLKTPFLHLALFLTSLGALLWEKLRLIRSKRSRFSRWRFYIHRAGIPLYLAAGFFAIITLSFVNLGHRLILMVIPLECLLAGNMMNLFLSRITRIPRLILIPGVMLLSIIPPLVSYPDYISYFNPIVRRKENAILYLTDSNVDWGQDIKPLGKYLKEHRIKKVNVSLFGTADPFYYGIKEWIDLGSWMILIPRHKKDVPDYTLPTAVSANMLMYVAKNYPEVMQTGSPVFIGGSMFLYPPYLKNDSYPAGRE